MKVQNHALKTQNDIYTYINIYLVQDSFEKNNYTVTKRNGIEEYEE
jgi:hypothetical protein